jgi:MinD superfamily P-loop ATPase
MRNSDMPAMPSGAIVRSRINRNDPGSDFFVVTETSAANAGMTKREEIAKANMAALLSNSAIIDTFAGIENVAKEAVRAADALLAALEVSQ